jgi:hypothetical protein
MRGDGTASQHGLRVALCARAHPRVTLAAVEPARAAAMPWQGLSMPFNQGQRESAIASHVPLPFSSSARRSDDQPACGSCTTLVAVLFNT